MKDKVNLMENQQKENFTIDGSLVKELQALFAGRRCGKTILTQLYMQHLNEQIVYIFRI